MEAIPTIFTNKFLLAHIHAKSQQMNLPNTLNELSNKELQTFIQKQL